MLMRLHREGSDDMRETFGRLRRREDPFPKGDRKLIDRYFSSVTLMPIDVPVLGKWTAR